MREYIQCAVLAISTVKFAEVVNWLPAPETAAQAAVLALVSGFIGAAGKWLFEKAKKKLRL
ncbi:hypothetical protein [Pontibacter sp. H249]|uniref:hypothetical protein n=1 Tax=Pontibacter sp. H249 TaxID=3133420 RepID=UPI0030BA9CC6